MSFLEEKTDKELHAIGEELRKKYSRYFVAIVRSIGEANGLHPDNKEDQEAIKMLAEAVFLGFTIGHEIAMNEN